MVTVNRHLVAYQLYCDKCKWKDKPNWEHPCNDCLTNPANFGTDQPINFVKAPKYGGFKNRRKDTEKETEEE